MLELNQLDHAKVMAHICKMTKQADLQGGLIGAGLGAAALPTVNYLMGKKKQVPYSALVGGLAGGAAGWGLSNLYNSPNGLQGLREQAIEGKYDNPNAPNGGYTLKDIDRIKDAPPPAGIPSIPAKDTQSFAGHMGNQLTHNSLSGDVGLALGVYKGLTGKNPGILPAVGYGLRNWLLANFDENGIASMLGSKTNLADKTGVNSVLK